MFIRTSGGLILLVGKLKKKVFAKIERRKHYAPSFLI